MAQDAFRELSGYLRKYHLAPRYPRGSVLRLTADDGTPIVAHRLGGPPSAVATAVVVHGFVNWSRNPAIHAFSSRLARHLHVVVPDLRGHGRSGGRCTLGHLEHLDVAAAVRSAPSDRPVVALGVSLGGVAALRHAATAPGSLAAVIAVSAPARRDASRPGSSRIASVTRTRAGRRALSTLMRTRLASEGLHLPDITGEVAHIAPSRCVIVHDRMDHFFGPEHASALFAAAREPKEQWWYEGVGHGLDLLTPAFADRVADWISEVAVSPRRWAPVIRPPTPADADAMGAVHVRAWQAAYRGVMPEAYLDGLRASDRAAVWRQAIDEGSTLLVVEDAGAVVGFAAFGPARVTGEVERSQSVGELYAINLDPDHWGKGLGRALLQASTSGLTAAGFEELVLWVVPQNARARSLYEREGWAADGTSRHEELFGVVVPELRYRRRDVAASAQAMRS